MITRKTAFTLSEVLIMMAIMGILGAIFMTNFTKMKPNKDAMLLRKAYSTIVEIVSLLANNEEVYPISPDDKTAYYKLFLNTSVPTGADYNNTNKFAYLFADKLNIKKIEENDFINNNLNPCVTSNCSFTTKDDIQWIIKDNFSSGKDSTITVITNPSPLASKKNTFQFTIKPSGRITLTSDNTTYNYNTAEKYLINRKNK